MLDPVERIKLAVEILANLTYENGINKQYRYLPVSNNTDTYNKYAIIANNEYLYLYKLYHKQKPNRIPITVRSLDLKECASILLEFYDVYNTPEGFDIIHSGISSRNDRFKMYKSKRYQKLKYYFRLMFTEPCCFKCGKTNELQMDHIKPHHNFKYMDLAFDISNLQWLCQKCNLEKGPNKEADYRTEKHMKEVKIMVEDYLKGNKIVQ